MNDVSKITFLETALAIRAKMAELAARDPVGNFCVRQEQCRSNIDRLASLDAWIVRLEAAS